MNGLARDDSLYGSLFDNVAIVFRFQTVLEVRWTSKEVIRAAELIF